MTTPVRIPLCVPSLGPAEAERLRQCLESTFVSSVGPFVDEFERRFAATVGATHAVACSSGTAALHLALRVAGVSAGDRVLCSDFTFIASATPIVHCGAEPVFIDSEPCSWNLDPALVAEELAAGQRAGRPYRAVIVVHIYGQPADLGPIRDACQRHGAILIEDATEALGATYTPDYPDRSLAGRQVGTVGDLGCFSFNGNKLITTGGGGMVVTANPDLAAHAKHLSTQAKLPGIAFVHDEVGYNYRLPNLNAALGLAQLDRLPELLSAKARIWTRYEGLADDCGWHLQPQPPGTHRSAWMPCLRVGPSRDRIGHACEEAGIAVRPVWIPLTRQLAFEGARRIGGAVADRLTEEVLCLPCSVDLTEDDQNKVCALLSQLQSAL